MYACMQENHLALRSEGVKMVVDSMRPHFVGIDPDLFSTGLVFYYLKVCGVYVRVWCVCVMLSLCAGWSHYYWS